MRIERDINLKMHAKKIFYLAVPRTDLIRPNVFAVRLAIVTDSDSVIICHEKSSSASLPQSTHRCDNMMHNLLEESKSASLSGRDIIATRASAISKRAFERACMKTFVLTI